MHAHGKDAADGRCATSETHVGGRITELAAELLAAHDMSADRETAAEQSRRGFEFAGRQMRADRAARNALGVDRDVRQRARNESMLSTQPLEHRNVAAPVVSETEIRADPDLARATARDEHALDEILGLHRGELCVETQQQQPIDAGRADALDLLAHARETRHGLAACEEFARYRFEADRARKQALRTRAGTHALEQRPMAEVHAIERADARDAAARSQVRPRGIPENKAHAASIAAAVQHADRRFTPLPLAGEGWGEGNLGSPQRPRPDFSAPSNPATETRSQTAPRRTLHPRPQSEWRGAQRATMRSMPSSPARR